MSAATEARIASAVEEAQAAIAREERAALNALTDDDLDAIADAGRRWGRR